MGTSVTPSVFVLPSKVMTRLQVNPDLEGLNDVLMSAIVGAQLYVSTILDSSLDLKIWTLAFFLDSESFSSVQPDGMFRLELPSGFVRSDADFIITYADNWASESPIAVDTKDYRVDGLRGMVYINSIDTPYADKYINVVCSTGFESGKADDLIASPPEAIPDWLEEAIIGYVGVVLDTSQTTNRNSETSAQSKKQAEYTNSILSSYIRKKGFSFRPITADWVDG